jgi:hypothetical protein
MELKKEGKIPPKNAPKTSSTILQFTTIFINFFNFDHFLNFRRLPQMAPVRA